MDFVFTEEQQRFREEIRDFCRTTPRGEIDTGVGPDFSPEFYRKVAEKRWLGLTLPVEYGGMGRGLMEATIFTEEMTAARAPMNLGGFGTHALLFGSILLKHGSEQQKRFYLPRITNGEIWIGQAFTETVGGSDLLANTTRAVREGDCYLINGEKMFSSWAHKGQYLRPHNIKHYVCLLARTNQKLPPDRSMSLFIFDGTLPLPGMSIRPVMTMGSRTNEVFFDDVKLSAESLIGVENQAWDYVVESGAFYWNRHFGMHVDMQEFLRRLVEYVKDTQVNGQALSQNALVRQRLAELATAIEALRLHTYRLAWAFDNDLDITGLGALTKFQSDRLGIKGADVAMQTVGPYGQLSPGSGYEPLNGAVEAMCKAGVLRSFSTTGPSAMPSVIAGYVLGLSNEFGLIY